MARTIPLSKGHEVIVDDEDYDWLSQWKWCAVTHKRTVYGLRAEYAKIDGKYRQIKRHKMHRFIMNAPDDMQVDHINGNGLDNRKCNLRLAYKYENTRNQRKTRGNTSKYKGIQYHKDKYRNKKWQARLGMNGKHISLGYYHTETEAAVAYNLGAIKYYGEFANVNIIED